MKRFVYLRSRFLLLAILPALLASAWAADDCSQKIWNWKVDRSAALEMQNWVNAGHEPWRMDDEAAVATSAIADRKKEWSDYNTVLTSPQLVSQTKDIAQLTATSQDGRVRYEVTLRKYPWLLQSAKDKWNWVIWLPASVERIECPSPPK